MKRIDRVWRVSPVGPLLGIGVRGFRPWMPLMAAALAEASGSPPMRWPYWLVNVRPPGMSGLPVIV